MLSEVVNPDIAVPMQARMASVTVSLKSSDSSDLCVETGLSLILCLYR
jgi:hypothetical protein